MSSYPSNIYSPFNTIFDPMNMNFQCISASICLKYLVRGCANVNHYLYGCKNLYHYFRSWIVKYYICWVYSNFLINLGRYYTNYNYIILIYLTPFIYWFKHSYHRLLLIFIKSQIHSRESTIRCRFSLDLFYVLNIYIVIIIYLYESYIFVH
jgi:hypothetical protein